jgi:hypothetical protein
MLNAEGLPSPNGRRWNAGAIKYMLHSRKYCGDLVYGRQQVGCYFRSTDGVVTAVTRNTPKGKNTPSVVVPGAMPRIIDERLWEAAQRKLKSNKTRAVSPGGHSYALRGILKCECGRGMTGVPERPELRAPPRYVCIGFKHMGSSVCHSNTVCEPALVDFLRHVIQNRIFPEDMLQDVEKRIRQMTARTHEPADELRELNRELKAMDARIAQGAKRLLAVSDAAVPDVAAALDELKAERARLAARLEELTRGSVKAADKRRERDEALGALMALRDLRAAVAVATGVELQHLFQTVFSRIDLRFSHKRNGKRMVNTLVGGTIAFYPVFSRSSTGSKS